MCSAQALGKMDAALPAAAQREDPGAHPINVGRNFKLERLAGFTVNERQKSNLNAQVSQRYLGK